MTDGFPEELAAVADADFDYEPEALWGGYAEGKANVGELDLSHEDDWIDYEPYEPYEGFRTPERTTDWLRAWTNNADVEGDAFRVFGQNGGGGYVAFRRVREGVALREQPVVFLGSEGELGVVARDLPAFLWLLAGGFGPFEAAVFGGSNSPVNAVLTEIAERFAPERRQEARTVLDEAEREYPGFEAWVQELCR